MASSKKEEIKKASPFTPRGGEIGQPGFTLSSSFVETQKEKALAVPKNYDTYKEMVDSDSCVDQALTATQTLLFLALYRGRYEESEYGTSTSKLLAEYMNHNILAASQTHWAEACQGFVTHTQDGLSLNEIVAKTATRGPYKGNLELIKLAHRLPSSIYAWVWDEDVRNPLKVVQKPSTKIKSLIRNRQTSSYKGNITDVLQYQEIQQNEYPVISLQKMIHMRFNPKGSDPNGRSPLVSCYGAWREKQIINKYQIIGVTRDFGGIPVVYAPNEFYEKAADPERYPNDAKAHVDLRNQLENLHAGREAFLMLTSDVYDGTNVKEWDIRFLGIEGGGKQFDIDQIIKAKNSEIYSAFSANYLDLGKDGKTGSYNLSTTGRDIHAFVLEREIINCTAQLDSFAKRMIEASGLIDELGLSYKDMPRFIPADPDQLSAEEFGKLIQRLGSVNKLTPEMFKHYAKLAGAPVEGIEDLDYTDKGESRAGEGLGTSGQGANDQNNSTLNVENKSMAINLVQDGDYLVDIVTGEVVNE